MSCSFLVPLQTTFTSLDIQDDGLMLTSCSCHGSSRVFLPRTHIDFVHSGRLFQIGMFLAGLILLVVGIVYQKHSDDQDANQKMAQILIGVGVTVMVLAILLTIPASLLISANNGIFVSTNLCGCNNSARFDEISKFVATGAMPEPKDVKLDHVQPYISSSSAQSYSPSVQPYLPGELQQAQVGTSAASPPPYGPRPHR